MPQAADLVKRSLPPSPMTPETCRHQYTLIHQNTLSFLLCTFILTGARITLSIAKTGQVTSMPQTKVLTILSSLSKLTSTTPRGATGGQLFQP